MKASVKTKRERAPKRNLFAEFSEGMPALAEERQGNCQARALL